MFKKLLMSGLVLGALAATVGGASFAAFDDTSVSTGTISAAEIEISSPASVTFSPQNLLPGEPSSTVVTVSNALSTRDVHLAVVPVVTGGTVGCPNTELSVTFSAADNDTAPDHGVNIHIEDGDQDDITLTATLNPLAPNDCQGVSFTVTTTFTGTGVADGS